MVLSITELIYSIPSFFSIHLPLSISLNNFLVNSLLISIFLLLLELFSLFFSKLFLFFFINKSLILLFVILFSLFLLYSILLISFSTNFMVDSFIPEISCFKSGPIKVYSKPIISIAIALN